MVRQFCAHSNLRPERQLAELEALGERHAHEFCKVIQELASLLTDHVGRIVGRLSSFLLAFVLIGVANRIMIPVIAQSQSGMELAWQQYPAS